MPRKKKQEVPEMNRWVMLLMGMAIGFLVGWFLFGYVGVTEAKENGNDLCKWTEWKDTTACKALECGTSKGMKGQERQCVAEECEYTCPVIEFKWFNKTFHVEYEKSQDPHKCHRPSDNTLTQLGMDRHARGFFKRIHSEWKDAKVGNCQDVVKETENRRVRCEAEVIPCGTKRWCFPCENDVEKASFAVLNGQCDGHKYHAQAIPQDANPEIGFPWEEGMDKWCEKEPEPTPTPTPEPKEPDKPSGCTENCNPPAPQCDAEAVVKEPANPHIYRKGGTALVKWIPTSGNKAIVYYKECSAGGWQHSVKVDNTGYTEIHELGNMDVCFAIEQVNDCGGGIVTAARSHEIVDGATSGWVLFR